MKQINQISILYPPGSEIAFVADLLARELSRYRVPGNVAKRIGISRLEEISEPWLIILCSPDAQSDPDICQAITQFTDRGLYQHILTLLISGTPDESFPDALLHEKLEDGTVIDHEPLAANISDVPGQRRAGKLRTEKLRLIAPILGVSFDNLYNRKRRQRAGILAALGSIVLLLLTAFLVVTVRRIPVFLEQNRQLTVQYERADTAYREALSEAQEANASYASAIGSGAQEALSRGDSELAMLLCLTLLPEHADVKNLTQAFRDALEMRGVAGYAPVTVLSEEQIEKFSDPNTGVLPAGLPHDYGMEWHHAYSCEGYLLYVYGEAELFVYDPVHKKNVASMTSFTVPLYPENVAFAGETDADTGARSAQYVRCGDTLFTYNEKETPLPESLDSQIALAKEYLGERVLTEEEMAYYGLE